MIFWVNGLIVVRHKGEGLGVSIEVIVRGGGMTDTKTFDLSENEAKKLFRRLGVLYGPVENK